jgi:hypothetical protein
VLVGSGVESFVRNVVQVQQINTLQIYQSGGGDEMGKYILNQVRGSNITTLLMQASGLSDITMDYFAELAVQETVLPRLWLAEILQLPNKVITRAMNLLSLDASYNPGITSESIPAINAVLPYLAMAPQNMLLTSTNISNEDLGQIGIPSAGFRQAEVPFWLHYSYVGLTLPLLATRYLAEACRQSLSETSEELWLSLQCGLLPLAILLAYQGLKPILKATVSNIQSCTAFTFFKPEPKLKIKMNPMETKVFTVIRELK